MKGFGIHGLTSDHINLQSEFSPRWFQPISVSSLLKVRIKESRVRQKKLGQLEGSPSSRATRIIGTYIVPPFTGWEQQPIYQCRPVFDYLNFSSGNILTSPRPSSKQISSRQPHPPLLYNQLI
ncbi:unnamed protein product [Orchesella dallaii]|uniref:Uncharacterized protein n=1 Tax=Orchesella dallaii TaxID=48710 RepID=A0ABP1QRD6_9HEXA